MSRGDSHEGSEDRRLDSSRNRHRRSDWRSNAFAGYLDVYRRCGWCHNWRGSRQTLKGLRKRVGITGSVFPLSGVGGRQSGAVFSHFRVLALRSTDIGKWGSDLCYGVRPNIVTSEQVGPARFGVAFTNRTPHRDWQLLPHNRLHHAARSPCVAGQG
jgi:hypothetical protein